VPLFAIIGSKNAVHNNQKGDGFQKLIAFFRSDDSLRGRLGENSATLLTLLALPPPKKR
jgi:hypothetical protein